MTFDIDLEEMTDKLAELASGRVRSLVALAGPPAAGKTYIAGALHRAIEARHPERSAVLGLDGYHYDDRALEARGTLARKGAPFTFDVDGFTAMLDRLAADSGRAVAVPVFDRTLEIARAGAAEIGPAVRVILVEGNYLLLDDPDWRHLAARFAMTVAIHAPEPVLVDRLSARWAEHDPEHGAERLARNDLPNMRLVLGASQEADFRLTNG
ncbi:nucleoside/nucleotide kinase family protein [Pelagibacterium montanilacus]|uniref:nucleoside/nucleotide kinase family protein n=1 Tax=Pelagibacterium montanilacus TaxID=2185280 RepID=UPI000F8CD04B|nr:nucleoside/nucleotide kinase family protein [Pelagibacterium montanilacus]